jgi:hypothetical protein
LSDIVNFVAKPGKRKKWQKSFECNDNYGLVLSIYENKKQSSISISKRNFRQTNINQYFFVGNSVMKILVLKSLPETQASQHQLIFLCRKFRGENIFSKKLAGNSGTKNTVVASLSEFQAKKRREIFTLLIRCLFKLLFNFNQIVVFLSFLNQ